MPKYDPRQFAKSNLIGAALLLAMALAPMAGGARAATITHMFTSFGASAVPYFDASLGNLDKVEIGFTLSGIPGYSGTSSGPAVSGTLYGTASGSAVIPDLGLVFNSTAGNFFSSFSAADGQTTPVYFGPGGGHFSTNGSQIFTSTSVNQFIGTGTFFVADNSVHLTATNPGDYPTLSFGPFLWDTHTETYGGVSYTFSSTEAVAEPAALGMFGFGLLGLGAARRRKRTASASRARNSLHSRGEKQ
ncbi:MAG: PEP-CTERM sorting domain-containing protein [Alphaproteobacteria bacterium]|jgi:hypothetical protein|nr:PEP-CTERM sorting domain-containing protein [Alphaproteobacteria bacterium]